MLLNVGGVRFETSRLTLTSVADTYLASLFSGRFALTADDDGAVFIDRDGRPRPFTSFPFFSHVFITIREKILLRDGNNTSIDMVTVLNSGRFPTRYTAFGLLNYCAVVTTPVLLKRCRRVNGV